MKQYLLLSASAGSGKTFSLVIRYLSLLFLGAKPSEILTTTFTRKATKEMKERISNRLYELKQAAKNNTLSEILNKKDFKEMLEASKNLKRPIDEELVRTKIDAIHEEFINTQNKITTLDSFFNSILRKFCWYVGVNNTFDIREYDNGEIFKAFLKDLKENEIENLAKFFYELKLNTESFIKLLELKEIKSQKYITTKSVEQILLDMTHTLEECIRAIESADMSNKNKVIDILNNKKHIKMLELCDTNFVKNPEKFFSKAPQGLQGKMLEYSRVFSALALEFFLTKEAKTFSLFETYHKRFKLYKNIFLRENNELSFEDVQDKVFELLCKKDGEFNHNLDFFYFRLDSRITHMLLDEFQDTSIVNYKILFPLLDEILAGSGRMKERSLFVVGDDKQSIYGFRGACEGVFAELKNNPKIKHDNLPHNYRAQGVIIDFINEVFAHPFSKFSESSEFVPQTLPIDVAKERSAQGFVQAKTIDEKNMVDEVISLLLELRAAKIDLERCAILVFTNKQAREIASAIATHKELLDINIITDESSKLHNIFPCNIIYHALNYEKMRLKTSQTDEYKKNMKFHKLALLKLLGKGIDEDIELPRFHDNVGVFVCEVIDTLHVGCALSEIFLENAINFTPSRVGDVDILEEFLSYLEDLISEIPKEYEAGLKIMTVHKSKGLEFDHVIMCDYFRRNNSTEFFNKNRGVNLERTLSHYKAKYRAIVDKDFNLAYEEHKKIQDKERLNLLYVAYTRARMSLHILQTKKNILQLDDRVIGSLGSLAILEARQKEREAQKVVKDGIDSRPERKFVSLGDLGRQEDFLRQAGRQEENLEGSFEAIVFGKCLHDLFELGSLNLVQNRYGFLLGKDKINNIHKLYNRAINNEALIKLKQDRKIFNEISFIDNGQMFRIDSLLIGESDIIVLDYKSGTKVEHEDYRMQVKRYVEFLRSITSREVSGYLVYPSANDMLIKVC